MSRRSTPSRGCPAPWPLRLRNNDADGNTLWFNGEYDGYTAVADFDGDPEGEIVVSGAGIVRLQDDDETVLWSTAVGGSTSGPPTVADLDGDGEPEIGVAGTWIYTALDTDGTTLWANPIHDETSGFTGSSVFDLEGDGVAEIVYADENDLWVFDGATGAVKLLESAHSPPPKRRPRWLATSLPRREVGAPSGHRPGKHAHPPPPG